MKIISKILLFFFILIIISCYEQSIYINRDNTTGQIEYKITYYNEYDNLISYLNNNFDIDLNTSIIFNKNLLEQTVKNKKNIKINNYNSFKIKNGKVAAVSFNYNDFNDFPNKVPFKYFPTRVYEENRLINYNTSISFLNLKENKNIKTIYNELKNDEKNVIDSYIKLVKLKFIFNTFKPITTNNLGELSKDKKTLIYETTLYNLLNAKKDININFAFRK